MNLSQKKDFYFRLGATIGFLSTVATIAACNAEKKNREFTPDPQPETVVINQPPIAPAPVNTSTTVLPQSKIYEGRFLLKSIECTQGQATNMAKSDVEMISDLGRNYVMPSFHLNNGSKELVAYNVKRRYEWTIQGSSAVKLVKTTVSVGQTSSVMTISKSYQVTLRPTGELALLHGNYSAPTYQGFNFDSLFKVIQKEFNDKAGENPENKTDGLFDYLKGLVSKFLNLNKYALNVFQEVAGIEEVVVVSSNGNDMIFTGTKIRHPDFKAVSETRAYDVAMCGLKGEVKRSFVRLP
jgi:hypothetical protein